MSRLRRRHIARAAFKQFSMSLANSAACNRHQQLKGLKQSVSTNEGTFHHTLHIHGLPHERHEVLQKVLITAVVVVMINQGSHQVGSSLSFLLTVVIGAIDPWCHRGVKHLENSQQYYKKGLIPRCLSSKNSCGVKKLAFNYYWIV